MNVTALRELMTRRRDRLTNVGLSVKGANCWFIGVILLNFHLPLLLTLTFNLAMLLIVHLLGHRRFETRIIWAKYCQCQKYFRVWTSGLRGNTEWKRVIHLMRLSLLNWYYWPVFNEKYPLDHLILSPNLLILFVDFTENPEGLRSLTVATVVAEFFYILQEGNKFNLQYS